MERQTSKECENCPRTFVGVPIRRRTIFFILSTRIPFYILFCHFSDRRFMKLNFKFILTKAQPRHWAENTKEYAFCWVRLASWMNGLFLGNLIFQYQSVSSRSEPVVRSSPFSIRKMTIYSTPSNNSSEAAPYKASVSEIINYHSGLVSSASLRSRKSAGKIVDGWKNLPRWNEAGPVALFARRMSWTSNERTLPGEMHPPRTWAAVFRAWVHRAVLHGPLRKRVHLQLIEHTDTM